jgi:hypothetical protein
MTTIMQQVEILVRTIQAKMAELDEVSGESLPTKLDPPAIPAQIAEVERQRGFTLPEDYRAFLLLHNGWKGFSGANALLSTSELLGGPIHDSIAALQSELRLNGLAEAANGFVFEGGYGTQVSYFDVTGPPGPEGPVVVFWDRGATLRYPSFRAFLQSHVEELDEMIAAERAQLR